MSIKVLVYVPRLSNDLLQKISDRFTAFGMECEFQPDFVFDAPTGTGWLHVRLRVVEPQVPQYNSALLSRFEISSKDFRYASPLAVNPAINEKLKPCTKVVTVRMHATPTSAVRAGMYFAALLAETGDGIMYTPRSDQYLAASEALQQAAQEVAAYENGLPAQDWNVVPFESWP